MTEKLRQIKNLEIWIAAEKLISLQPGQREEGLDYLFAENVFCESPLAAYLLATRITDDDLEVRFHSIQYLGILLDYEGSENPGFNDQALKYVHNYLIHLGEREIRQILEVAEAYLSAEEAITNILKMNSYAGSLLSGIVNDRKNSSYLRQQAVYFGGEVGLVEMVPILENLILRIEKRRKKLGRALSAEQIQEEEELYATAVTALEKMKSSYTAGRTKL